MMKKSYLLKSILRNIVILGIIGAVFLAFGWNMALAANEESVATGDIALTLSEVSQTLTEVASTVPDEQSVESLETAIVILDQVASLLVPSDEVSSTTLVVPPPPPLDGSFAISDEVSVSSLPVTPPPSSNFAISDEVSVTTLAIPPPPPPPAASFAISDEVSATTDKRGGGGGGGGGGRRDDGDSPVVTPPAPEPAPLFCPEYLHKYIRLGWPNDPVEVVKLQVFLQVYEGLEVPITGVYDLTTFKAVEIFQMRYGRDVLNPWGLSDIDPTGFVFVTTRLTVNNIYCERSTVHGLDLRNIYRQELSRLGLPLDNIDDGIPFMPTTGGDDSELPDDSVDPIVPVQPEETPRRDFLQAAALGLLDFIIEYPTWWLILLLISTLGSLFYLIWLVRKEKPDEVNQNINNIENMEMGDIEEILPAENESDDELIDLEIAESDNNGEMILDDTKEVGEDVADVTQGQESVDLTPKGKKKSSGRS